MVPACLRTVSMCYSLNRVDAREPFVFPACRPRPPPSQRQALLPILPIYRSCHHGKNTLQPSPAVAPAGVQIPRRRSDLRAKVGSSERLSASSLLAIVSPREYSTPTLTRSPPGGTIGPVFRAHRVPL